MLKCKYNNIQICFIFICKYSHITQKRIKHCHSINYHILYIHFLSTDKCINWLMVGQSCITHTLIHVHISTFGKKKWGVAMKMESALQDGVSQEWGHLFLVCIRGPDKSISSDDCYLVVPAWSGDIAAPTVSSSAWSLLLSSACLFKVWISSSGISRSLITSFSLFSSNDLFVYMKHTGQTLKCHLRSPFVLPYFIDKQQVNQWQSVAGTWSPLGSPGRAVATLKVWRIVSGFKGDQSSGLYFLSSKYSVGNNYS